MSINGVLEDLALADVLQFIHLGRRTGTLYMWQDDARRAEIGFHDGKIFSAWAPGQQKLGNLLVAADLLDAADLEAALEFQDGAGQDQSLGQILLDRGAVTREDIHSVIRQQVETTIFELVTWQHGRFHFEVDELHPIDDIGLAPGELLGDLDLNTQMLLLEATRIFDERQRRESSGGESGALSPLDRHLKLAGLGRTLSPEERITAVAREGEVARRDRNTSPSLESIRCQVVSQDADLFATVREGLPAELARVVAVKLREAGTRLPGESASPIVVLDLRGGPGVDAIATLARTRPTALVVAVVGGRDEAPAAHSAGAIAVVEAGDGAVVDCCRNLIRVFSHPQPQGTFGYLGRGGFSRFRRVVFDVQSGLLSATMALNLMHVISESVERAVLFLVQGHELRAVGAFGFADNGEPLARLTSGMRLNPDADCALTRALDEAKPQSLGFDEAALPADLARLLGPPANGQIVIFPVLGAERPISVIYTDNGTLPDEIQDIKILELATSQVGVAFENELLRQRMDSGDELDPILD